MKLSPVILFRTSDFDSIDELSIANKHFDIYKCRTLCKDSLVISRYSCLPYYEELERDLQFNNCKLINSYTQHKYIANFDWYYDVPQYTFPTWFDSISKIPDNIDGPFVLKGRTNSRKRNWNTEMFAKNQDEAIKIQCRLLDDDMIGPQGIVIRKYEELESYGTGINGQIFANEWRFFFYKRSLLSYGYYWTIADEHIVKNARIDGKGLAFAREVAGTIANKVNFFVLDIARRKDGVWRLVEVNDGQMSGLPENDMAEYLYSNLAKELNVDNIV